MDSQISEITESPIKQHKLEILESNLKTPNVIAFKDTDELLAKWLNTIQCIDCIEGMKKLPSNCVDMVVTSPPYDGIRDYKGFSIDLSTVGKEVFRILKNGGIAAMVIQDQTVNFGKLYVRPQFL